MKNYMNVEWHPCQPSQYLKAWLSETPYYPPGRPLTHDMIASYKIDYSESFMALLSTFKGLITKLSEPQKMEYWAQVERLENERKSKS